MWVIDANRPGSVAKRNVNVAMRNVMRTALAAAGNVAAKRNVMSLAVAEPLKGTNI